MVPSWRVWRLPNNKHTCSAWPHSELYAWLNEPWIIWFLFLLKFVLCIHVHHMLRNLWERIRFLASLWASVYSELMYSSYFAIYSFWRAVVVQFPRDSCWLFGFRLFLFLSILNSLSTAPICTFSFLLMNYVSYKKKKEYCMIRNCCPLYKSGTSNLTPLSTSNNLGTCIWDEDDKSILWLFSPHFKVSSRIAAIVVLLFES